MDKHTSLDGAKMIEPMLASMRLGKWKSAAQQANGVALLDRPAIGNLALAGHILETCGAWPDAARLYRRFASIEPALLYPRFRLCHVLLRQQNFASAELHETLEKIEAAAPNNPRIKALKSWLAQPPPPNLPPTFAGCLWRRWFRGKADWEEGAAVRHADLAVVVIGFRAQPGLLKAVQSLLEQDDEAEIVVVNSGGGDVYGLLTPHSARLRIINIQEPLYAGAARNVGIDASEAPYVAFLAGDCVARPGWIRLRRDMHRRGSKAVASAIAYPKEERSNLALAAHLVLFGARSPEVPPTQALRYGASYHRQVFREFGYFNPSLRTGEDTDFAHRIRRNIHPAWNPHVQTEHASPRGFLRFILDMYRRGKRATRHRAPAHNQAFRWSELAEIVASAQKRKDIAESIARDILKIDKRRLAGAKKYLFPATLAYGVGTFMELRTHQAAVRDHERSIAVADRQATALHNVEMAVSKNPENLEFLLNAADRCLGWEDNGARRKGADYIDSAARVAGFQERQLLRLADWLIARGLRERAWLLGDNATIDLPHAVTIHHQLALAAYNAGDHAAFELAALDALARNPDLNDLWIRFPNVMERCVESTTSVASR